MHPEVAFVSAGGNRHTAAADFDASGLLAFGAGNGVALWRPEDTKSKGVLALLNGHTAAVNAVRFLRPPQHDKSLLVTGSSDKTVRIWQPRGEDQDCIFQSSVLARHDSAINAICVCHSLGLLITASADANVRVWSIHWPTKRDVSIKLLQSLTLSPRYFALTLDVCCLPATNSVCLAVAGTRPIIQLFVSSTTNVNFQCVATLTGHEAWIRSLAFTPYSQGKQTDILLASASQDKYVRLWRIRRVDQNLSLDGDGAKPEHSHLKRALSNRSHRFKTSKLSFEVTFEALLVGHEDWIYSVRWLSSGDRHRLLTASADSSLSIWELESESGVWISTIRLGEASAQKGATTATGSAGGFWNCLWSSDGTSVYGVGRTGSWRVWQCVPDSEVWKQHVGVTGHTREVRSIAWSRDGSYLLSTSSDQTTRLFGERLQDARSSWHELSRPQIHGYDLNCIATITPTQFISGADEKLFRVFDEPRTVADLVANVAERSPRAGSSLPVAADIPVLGLSNKAISESNDGERNGSEETDSLYADGIASAPTNAVQRGNVPTEDQLARHLLWPETEKLYGHGYEVCTVAANHEGNVVATACRASSLDHAVIRLYETKTWQEVKPFLKAHTLTVTALEFSPDDRYLLSVGRDRQCFLFKRADGDKASYVNVASEPKAHSRMILDASWAHTIKEPRVFATAGRDKNIYIWTLRGDSMISRKDTLSMSAAVTAVAFNPERPGGHLLLAFGLENGTVFYVLFSEDDLQRRQPEPIMIPQTLTPSAPITSLAWRPKQDSMARPSAPADHCCQLAIASEDSSLRILRIFVDP